LKAANPVLPNATHFPRLLGVCIDGGADAPVRGRPPGRPIAGAQELIPRAKSGSRGTRAVQGDRPTNGSKPQPLIQENKH
jgi:hypothetical protein